MKWGAFRALLSILALNAPPTQSTRSSGWTASRKIASRHVAGIYVSLPVLLTYLLYVQRSNETAMAAWVRFLHASW